MQRSGSDTVALVPSRDGGDPSQVALTVAPEWYEPLHVHVLHNIETHVTIMLVYIYTGHTIWMKCSMK